MPATVRSHSNRARPQQQQEQQWEQRSTLARMRLSAQSRSIGANEIVEDSSRNDRSSRIVVTPVYETIGDSYSPRSSENDRAQKTAGFGGEDFTTDSKNATNKQSSLGSEALRFVYGPSPSLHANVFQIPPTFTPEELDQSYKEQIDLLDLTLDCPPQYQKEAAILLGATEEQLKFLNPKGYFEIKRDAIIHAYDILKRKDSRIQAQKEEEDIVESVAGMDSDTRGGKYAGCDFWSEENVFGNEGVGKDEGTVKITAMTDASTASGVNFEFGKFKSQENEWGSNEVVRKDENDNVETEADCTHNEESKGGVLKNEENGSVAKHFEYHPWANISNDLDDDETIDYESDDQTMETGNYSHHQRPWANSPNDLDDDETIDYESDDQTMEAENYSHHQGEDLRYYMNNGDGSKVFSDGDESAHADIGDSFSQSGYKHGKDGGPPIGPKQLLKGYRQGRHHRNKSPTDPAEYFKQHPRDSTNGMYEDGTEAFDPFETDSIIGEFIDSMGESVDDTLTSVEVICNSLCCQAPEKYALCCQAPEKY